MRALLAAPVIAIVAGCQDQIYEPAEVLNNAFLEAAEETEVPRDLLAAVAHAESRLDHRAGAIDKYGRVGVMGLSVDGSDPSIHRAAELMGMRHGAIEGDVSLQVMAGAKLLRAYAEEEYGTVPTELEKWWPMLERYSGAPTDRLRAGYARQVFRFLEGGFVHRTTTGERVELIGRPIDLDYAAEPSERSGTDYPGAAAFDAAAECNYTASTRGPGDIDYVVIHTAEGSYSGTVSWFQNCSAGASAHYVVRSSDGEVTQMLDEDDIGWHAGNWDYNEASIGIEHEGYTASGNDWYTEAMYRESAALVRDICDRYGIPKDRAHIIGHDEVPDPYGSGYGGAGHHTDPGSYWDWDYFISLVNDGAPAEVSDPTGDLTGYVRVDDIYTGAGISGATVSLSDGSSTTTDSSGLYAFYELDPGAYTVTVSASGYDSASLGKDVQADLLNWGSVALSVSGGSTPADTGSSEPPVLSVPGAPTDLSPYYEWIWDDAVTMSWSPTGDSAYQYEVEIWYFSEATRDWHYYYTYVEPSTSKTFWPYLRDTGYAFIVRGYNDAGWGPWSSWGFYYAP